MPNFQHRETARCSEWRSAEHISTAQPASTTKPRGQGDRTDCPARKERRQKSTSSQRKVEKAVCRRGMYTPTTFSSKCTNYTRSRRSEKRCNWSVRYVGGVAERSHAPYFQHCMLRDLNCYVNGDSPVTFSLPCPLYHSFGSFKLHAESYNTDQLHRKRSRVA